MEFGRKRNCSPSGNFYSGVANICFKKSKNGESPEIKVHVSESLEIKGHASESLEINGHASKSVARDDEKLPGCPGQSIFRILVPMEMDSHLGCDFPLKALEKYEDIKAQIEFIVGPQEKRVVMVSAKEEPDSPLPPAVDGLLKVHRFFLDWLRDDMFPPIPEGKFITTLLVPAVQVSSLIKSSTIKFTEQMFSCTINVFGEGCPVLRDDLMVWVSGKSEGVHKAVESIASYLSNFLVDQSIIPTIKKKYHLLGKPPHLGISLYGRETSLLARSSSNQSSSSQSAQFTIIETSSLRVKISQLYADAIIGIEGANITCIRRLTGATFTVDEMQEEPDQIVVKINGSRSQVRNAERLMLMFIAEAGGPQSTDSLYKDKVSALCRHMHYPQLKPRLANELEKMAHLVAPRHDPRAVCW